MIFFVTTYSVLQFLCRPDLEFLQKNIDSKLLERLEHVASVPFRRISYTEAVEILTTAIREKQKKFENAKVQKSDEQPALAMPFTLTMTLTLG